MDANYWGRVAQDLPGLNQKLIRLDNLARDLLHPYQVTLGALNTFQYLPGLVTFST